MASCMHERGRGYVWTTKWAEFISYQWLMHIYPYGSGILKAVDTTGWATTSEIVKFQSLRMGKSTNILYLTQNPIYVYGSMIAKIHVTTY